MSISVPLLYKWTEPSPDNLQRCLQAFSMELGEYLLIRAFLFYLLRKQYVVFPSSLLEVPHSPLKSTNSPDLSFNAGLSPKPLSPMEENDQAVLSVEESIAASRVLGIPVDQSGIDEEFNRTKNSPPYVLKQKVEINRVNRYLSCAIIPPATSNVPLQNVYLAIGRSHVSLLEMVKGSLKDATVQMVFSLYELIDICIEDNSRRTVSILVGMIHIMIHILQLGFLAIGMNNHAYLFLGPNRCLPSEL